MHELTTTAVLSNLAEVMAFVDRACSELGVHGSDAFAVKLAVEEVCTNVMSYGYAGREPGSLQVTLGLEAGRLLVRVEDRGTAFPPDSAPAPDLHSAAEERRVGGLGIHLVKQMMDDVSYTSAPGGGNVLVMVKSIVPSGRGQHSPANPH